MHISLDSQEIVCTLVYFGPDMSGKQANFECIKDRVEQHASQQHCSIETSELASERILSLSIVPKFLPQVEGYTVRLQLLTIPGGCYVNTNKRKLLEQADAIVFVADASRGALEENIDALNEMWSFINTDIVKATKGLPVLVQMNGQAADSLPFEQLNPLLNSNALPVIQANTSTGAGVLETLYAVGALLKSTLTPDAVALAKGAALVQPITTTSPVPLMMPQTRAITCCSCKAVLEVSTARVGDVYSCGGCSVHIEIVSLETGETRVPGIASAVEPISPNISQPSVPLDVSALTRNEDSNETILQGSLGAASASLSLPGYTVEAILDASSHGSRYLVKNTHGQFFRALALDEEYIAQPHVLEQLEERIRTVNQIKHPSFIPVVSLERSGQTPVLLSEHKPNTETLTEILARRRVLAPPQSMGIIRQLALALEEAARIGIMHSWLRPDIILVTGEGTLYIDELAVPTAGRFLVDHRTGASGASEYYLAPELIDSDQLDIRTDIFLLGAILFRMITGRGLVKGYSAYEALVHTRSSGVPTMRSCDPNISKRLSMFAARLSALNRDERFQDYGELIRSIDSFGGGAERHTKQFARKNTARISRRSQTGQTKQYRNRSKTVTGQQRKSTTQEHRRSGQKKESPSLPSDALEPLAQPLPESEVNKQRSQTVVVEKDNSTAVVVLSVIVCLLLVVVAILSYDIKIKSDYIARSIELKEQEKQQVKTRVHQYTSRSVVTQPKKAPVLEDPVGYTAAVPDSMVAPTAPTAESRIQAIFAEAEAYLLLLEEKPKDLKIKAEILSRIKPYKFNAQEIYRTQAEHIELRVQQIENGIVSEPVGPTVETDSVDLPIESAEDSNDEIDPDTVDAGQEDISDNLTPGVPAVDTDNETSAPPVDLPVESAEDPDTVDAGQEDISDNLTPGVPAVDTDNETSAPLFGPAEEVEPEEESQSDEDTAPELFNTEQ